MLDPAAVRSRLQEHFDRVSEDAFARNLERFTPDLLTRAASTVLCRRAMESAPSPAHSFYPR